MQCIVSVPQKIVYARRATRACNCLWHRNKTEQVHAVTRELVTDVHQCLQSGKHCGTSGHAGAG